MSPAPAPLSRPAAALAVAMALAAWAMAAPAATSLAQKAPAAMPPPSRPALEDTPAAREMVHLGALGAYSAGFVLESYGYIGLLADVLHYGIYEPEQVKSMLGETRVFLQKALDKLEIYRQGAVTVQPEDLAFINGIAEIISLLIAEADGLYDYCDGFDKADFERFRDSRSRALELIKRHLGVK